MSTLDKINSELTALQKDLDELNHYTEEIGKAKDSSIAVIKMSQEFLSSFQKRVTEINNEMTKAAKDFENRCNESASEFEDANKAFKQGINQAKETLSEIGTQLSVAAKNVNDLTAKIEAINILGHFEKVHSTFGNLNNQINDYHLKTTSKLTQTENTIQLIHKKTSTKITLLIGITIINILLAAFIVVKVMK